MSKKIQVGAITSPHGVKGAFKVKSFTSPEDNIVNMETRTYKGDLVKLRKIRTHNTVIICKADGVIDRNMAEDLRGTKLFVEREKFPELIDNEYYLEDLKGIDVQNSKQEVIGKVVSVHNFGAEDVVEIKFKEGPSEMYPFEKEIFPEVSREFITFVEPDNK
jgi:16S rRNA processing protein RimM